jgi:hypothetical protein
VKNNVFSDSRDFSGKHSFTLHSFLDPYRQRSTYTRFAWAGGTCSRFARAGGTFFPVVLLFQFFVLAGNRFWFYIVLMYLEYHTVVVLCWFFWFWREIVFGFTYVLSVLYSCVVVSFFLLWRES